MQLIYFHIQKSICTLHDGMQFKMLHFFIIIYFSKIYHHLLKHMYLFAFWKHYLSTFIWVLIENNELK